MGKPGEHESVLQYILSFLPGTPQYEPLILQSMTLKMVLPYRVHLQSLPYEKYLIELELFPCASLRNKQECVNIFESGKIILTGIRRFDRAKELFNMVSHDILYNNARIKI